MDQALQPQLKKHQIGASAACLVTFKESDQSHLPKKGSTKQPPRDPVSCHPLQENLVYA